MITATLFGALILLMALGIPVAFAMGFATVAAVLVSDGLPLIGVAQKMFSVLR